MNKLDKNAIWLFFFQYFIGFLFLLPFFFIFPAVMLGFIAGVTGSNSFFIFIPLFFVLYIISLAIFPYLLAYLSYENWKYEFSKEAIKIEKGIIWKKYISIPYERVQNVDIYRGIFARMLGLSDLQIQTPAIPGQHNMEWVPKDACQG